MAALYALKNLSTDKATEVNQTVITLAGTRAVILLSIAKRLLAGMPCWKYETGNFSSRISVQPTGLS